jgi:HK97 family phage major capsid protein
MAKLKDAREKAVAAFKALDTFAKTNGIDDANELNEGGAKASFKVEFEQLEKAAWDADAEYKTAEQEDSNGQRVSSARDRLGFYSKAVTGKDMGFVPLPGGMQPRPMTLGQEFTESDAYKALIESGALRSDESKMSFTSDPIASSKRFAATDEISTYDPDTSAGPLVTPFYLPGILGLPQRPLTVRELFTNSPMGESDLISYARQTAFDNAAAAVSQAAPGGNPTGAKPQSSIGWARQTSAVTTIATWMASTRQALRDASQIRSLIDNQGRLMIQIEEEDQLLSGDGAAPNLEGIQSIAEVQTLDLTGVDTLDGIRHSKTMIRTGASRLVADAIVVHPDDSEAIDLLKDDNGLYRGGNPIGNFTFNQPIWSLRRVESEGVSAGTAIVGAFRAGATVFERQPITVYTSDSHSDFFIKNLIAVLFEESLAFPVFFPTAFVVLSIDTLTASGDEGIVSD